MGKRGRADFCDLIELLHMKSLTKLLANMPAGATGIEGETNLKVKQRF